MTERILGVLEGKLRYGGVNAGLCCYGEGVSDVRAGDVGHGFDFFFHPEVARIVQSEPRVLIAGFLDGQIF